jgi:DNA-directed RNA polymerase subunit RPC12/RpoP
MTCKKCGSEMRLWLLRPAFRSFACQSCEFVAIVREDSQQPKSPEAPEARPRGGPHDVVSSADRCTVPPLCRASSALERRRILEGPGTNARGRLHCQWQRSAKLFPMTGASPLGARPESRTAWCGSYREELDMSTLVWTRGRGFPLSRLESRLRCPMCGSRDVVLLITIPRETQTARAAKR